MKPANYNNNDTSTELIFSSSNPLHIDSCAGYIRWGYHTGSQNYSEKTTRYGSILERIKNRMVVKQKSHDIIK